MIFIRSVEQEGLNYDYSKDEKEIEKFLKKYGPKTLFQKCLKVMNIFLYIFIFLILFIKIGQFIMVEQDHEPNYNPYFEKLHI